MKNVIILATILRLLFATVRSQPSRELNLINQLNDFFCFDHNIFLLDDSVQDHQRYIPINAETLTPQTVYIFDYKNNLNRTINTQREQLRTLTAEAGQNTFLIVISAEFSFEFTKYGAHILNEVIEIQRIKRNVKIGIFFEMNISSMEMVLQLFQWSWSNKIMNIFCVFYSNVKDDALSEVFTAFRYDPFEAGFLINLTGSNSLQDYFTPDSKIPNYRHHQFRLFRFAAAEVKHFPLNYWLCVINIFNASVSVVNVSEQAYAAERYGAVHDDAGLIRANERKLELLTLYPDGFSWFQLVVPHAQPYESIVAYLQNSTWDTLIGYTFVVIATASLLLAVSSYLQAKKKNSFVQCVVDVVNLIINDNFHIKYGQLHRADICIVVPLTFTGLIVTNGILSVFKSYLTVPIYQPQMKTINQIYDSHISISAQAPFWANDTIRMLEALTTYKNWRERVLQTETSEYFTNLKQFNNSVAYGAVSWHVRPCFYVQKRLNLRSYYLITDQKLGQYFVTFPVNPDFPFLQQLNMLHQRLVCHGMTKKWEADEDEKEVSRLMKAKRLSVLQYESNSGSSDSSGFGGMFTIVWCGWIAAGLVFIYELIWNRFQPQINKLKHTFWMCTRNAQQERLLLTVRDDYRNDF